MWRNFSRILLIAVFIVLFDIFIWWQILFFGPVANSEIYGLDVGQGDSELVLLLGGPKVLIDGGPDNKVLSNLSTVLGPTDRYIDLVILSHPQTDHFTGLIDVFKRYKVGAFIYNGQSGVAPSWNDLVNVVRENQIPAVALKEGDRISYSGGNFDILSPSPVSLQNKDVNLGALVLRLETQNSRAIFTADIDAAIEKQLAQNYDLNADVLKVSHHGSKFSSSDEFLKAVSPKISFIEVGAKNTYGHPTPQTVERLTAAGSKIFRTDQNGLIKIDLTAQGIRVWDEK